jgi:hypothetical protein
MLDRQCGDGSLQMSDSVGDCCRILDVEPDCPLMHLLNRGAQSLIAPVG